MSDVARKRTLADWVVKTKKQVVKLYAVAKWSRDADVVQKCMVTSSMLCSLSPVVHVGLEYHRIPHGPKSTI